MISDAPKPRIVQLAERIQDDIRRRGLKPGDAYLSTVATARMLGVGNQVAGRALQLLASRRVIDRRQRKGTTVLAPEGQSAPSVDCVHLLVHENYVKREGLMADGTVIGLQQELPGVDVRFNFMQSFDPVEMVERLVGDALRGSRREAFVLTRASLAAQRAVAESGLPAVVHGTLHPSVRGLAWLDRDNYNAGELLAGYLAERGYSRLVLLLRELLLPGDHRLLDGVRDAIDRGGWAPSALAVRGLPSDAEAIKDEMRKLLSGGTGVICRSEPAADLTAEAARDVGLAVGGEWGSGVGIVVSDVYRKPGHVPAWPHVDTALTPQQIGRRIGAMLAAQAAGRAHHASDPLIPVRLELP
jgi:DNA-binding LacI/PurR family transcriptional regulator